MLGDIPVKSRVSLGLIFSQVRVCSCSGPDGAKKVTIKEKKVIWKDVPAGCLCHHQLLEEVVV